MYVIAEVGGNHDGSLNQALKLIEQASSSGADAVKFQSYEAEKLVHPGEKALPQAKGYTRQIDRFKDLEFEWDQWLQIIECCKRHKIDFLTTCFDLITLEKFNPYMKAIKVSSGDLTYHRLLRQIALIGKPVILSTGMATYQEIDEAAWFFPNDRLTILHCVTSYPCPLENANLGVIRKLQEKYNTGYSDHTIGNTACQLAVALGCTVIEKHFTLDNTKEWGDHPLSATPKELRELIDDISSINLMMGEEKPDPIEKQNLRAMRRGAYASKDLPFGHIVNENDILALRPATTRKPHDMIGTRTRKDFKELEALG